MWGGRRQRGKIRNPFVVHKTIELAAADALCAGAPPPLQAHGNHRSHRRHRYHDCNARERAGRQEGMLTTRGRWHAAAWAEAAGQSPQCLSRQRQHSLGQSLPSSPGRALFHPCIRCPRKAQHPPPITMPAIAPPLSPLDPPLPLLPPLASLVVTAAWLSLPALAALSPVPLLPEKLVSGTWKPLPSSSTNT